MKLDTKIIDFIIDIMEFCEGDPYLSKELIKERERFFTIGSNPKFFNNQSNWIVGELAKYIKYQGFNSKGDRSLRRFDSDTT